MKKWQFLLYLTIGFVACNVSIEDFEPFYPKPYYSEEYIVANKGALTFEISPTQELLCMIHVLTFEVEIEATAYQERFTNYFSDYLDHPIFALYRSKYRGRGYRTKLISGAYGFSFTEDNLIDAAISSPPRQAVSYEFLTYRAVLEDFAIQSNFMAFFRQEAAYHQAVLEQQKQLMPVPQMIDWLGERFPVNYDSHKVIFFMIGMGHSSASYHTKKFSENVNMIEIYTNRERYTPTENEGFASRMIFTEIDHAYVYPLTEKYAREIKQAFKDKAKWSQNTTGSYTERTSIFDEYFTHGLFFLYALDYYEGEALTTIIEAWTTVMIEQRNFIKFNEFKDELLRIYQESPAISMDDLYLQIIDWAANE